MKLKRIIVSLLLGVAVVGAIFFGVAPEKEVSVAEKQSDCHNETVSDRKKEAVLEESIAREPAMKMTVEPEASVPPHTDDTAEAELTQELKNNEIPVNTCTISIRCDTILQNIDKVNPDKISIVPPDGIILSETPVGFESGESVFDLLIKTVLDRGIHMEYSETPMYESAYIEGISNLYEFDCGDMSGWIYKVNGIKPNVGCSKYILQNGDIVEWLYTCDLGRDV